MTRIECICTFFRDVASLGKGADKTKIMNMQAQNNNAVTAAVIPSSPKETAISASNIQLGNIA